MLSLHPATEGVLTDNDWLKRDENFLKKKFQKVLVIKKEFLPCTRKQRKKFSEKEVRHVHRHIELTAVPKEISEQQKWE